MKVALFDLNGNKAKMIELPEQFNEEFRPDIIMRSFLAAQSASRQPYGSYIRAGQRYSADISKRRRDFKTSYGHGISRTPRKSLWRRGTQFGWVGAFSPHTVGGRRAHPPRAYKILEKEINKKEKRKALRSAIAATIVPEIVKQRGHLFNELPSIVEKRIEEVAKTKDFKQIMIKLKLQDELERSSASKVRPGRGKMRGRRYKTKKGPLVVVGGECPLLKAANNVPGVDVVTVNNLRIHLVAPGGVPGRLTLFSENAIDKMRNDRLFTDLQKKETKEKEPPAEKPKVAKIIKQTPSKPKRKE